MHPDALAAVKIGSELPLDKDIAEIISSPYVSSTNLLLSQVIRNSKITGKTSDGYHTFDELYDHRITLYIKICQMIHAICGGEEDKCTCPVWRSERHSDGTSIPDWFVLGIHTDPGKQITYHLPMSRWDECKFAKKLHKAPVFDGHTSADVLGRISKL